MSEETFDNLKKLIREALKRKRLHDPSCEYVEFSMIMNTNKVNFSFKPPETLKIRVKDKIVSTIIDGGELTFSEENG